jgi:hypothetical protein
MKKLLVISLILCLAFALASATTFAQSGDGTVQIIPWAQDELTVSPDDELILHTGWAACKRGLVRTYINAAHYQWSINGDPILSDEETAQYFGPIEFIGPRYWCLIGDGTAWRSYWDYSIGTLEPGTYEIGLVRWLDHPVIDGGDHDGDGRLDHFEGVMGDDSVIVHVE